MQNVVNHAFHLIVCQVFQACSLTLVDAIPDCQTKAVYDGTIAPE
jgi:hypothetical protein